VYIGLISIYPPRGQKHSETSGVAPYTKNLVDKLALDKSNRIIVFAEKNGKEEYCENGVRIIRCWSKSPKYVWQILSCVRQYKLEIIHIQHELFLFGGALEAILFPLLMLLLRTRRIRVVVTIHGVVSLKKLDKDFIKANNYNYPPFAIKIVLSCIYRPILLLCTKTIVHEKLFKKILIEEYGTKNSKVRVVPLGIEETTKIDKNLAKRKLGIPQENIILYFGYLCGYKGIEILIDAFKYLLNDDCVLIMAGGEHPKLKNDPSYKKYLSGLYKKAEGISEKIVFTGFVPEEKIPLYFSAADITVFPHIVSMAASGPLALAVGYDTPFLISDTIGQYLDSKEPVFQRNPIDLSNKIKDCLDGSTRDVLVSIIDKLKVERSWDNVKEMTSNLYQQALEKQ